MILEEEKKQGFISIHPDADDVAGFINDDDDEDDDEDDDDDDVEQADGFDLEREQGTHRDNHNYLIAKNIRNTNNEKKFVFEHVELFEKEILYDSLNKIINNKSFKWFCLYKSMDSTYCGRLYTKDDKLWEHIKRHCYGGRGWRCGNCNKTFSARAGVRKHITNKYADATFLCGECGEEYPYYMKAFRCCGRKKGAKRREPKKKDPKRKNPKRKNPGV